MTSLLLPRLVPRQRKPLDEASWATLRAVDELLQDKTLPYDTLRGRLNTVPKSQRGVDWAERVVKIYCCKLMKAQRCNALINNIGAIRQANGDTDKHIAFQDTLGRLTAPKILTLHGYTLPLRSMDQPTVIAEIKNLIRLLADLGYQSFINSGTLLGAVREQALLGHDAELAILIEGVDERELVRNFAEIGNALNQTGALAKPAVLSKGSPVTKIELRSGVVLDLFPIWIWDGRAFVWPHTFGELGHEDVFPLSTQTLGGIAVPAPKNAEKMLVLNYGEGWRSPDTYFKFPWETAKTRFAKIIRQHKRYRRKTWVIGRIRVLLGRSK